MKQKTFYALNILIFTTLLLISAKTAASSIRGFVWNDLNTNGIQDAGESGLGSAWVLLLDANGNQIASAYTDANGNYSFDSVAPGAYILRFANPGGVWQTLQNQGNDDSKDSDADPLGFTDSFTIAAGQSLDFDAGFTTVSQGCFTPVTITVSAVTCNDNGTPDPNDDTFTFAITATGGTGPWGWDLLLNLMMIPYGTPYTFGPYQIINGAITLTINDHDNPSCTATVTVNPPASCSSPNPPNPTLTLHCSNNISASVPAGSTGTVVNFPAPTATTTCPGGIVTMTQTLGPPSGSTFPIGSTDVCFVANDTCGNADACCFKVNVATAPANPPCDEKVIGCIKYELLGIKLDADLNRTYTIRVTNNCANKLIYTAFQVPDGGTAIAPPNNSVYTAPSGRKYDVRNPNFSPFYSIRFKSTTDSIFNGQSDVFEYTLPVQSAPDYIHVIVRVAPKIFYESHLNTFDCVPTMNVQSPVPFDSFKQSTAEKLEDEQQEVESESLKIYPNPTENAIFAQLAPWKGQSVKVCLLNSQGRCLEILTTEASEESFPFELAGNLPNGLYFVEVIPVNGKRQVQKFLLQR